MQNATSSSEADVSAPRVGKESLKEIAASTLKKLEQGTYELDGIAYALKEAIKNTNEHASFYTADSNLSEWASNAPSLDGPESHPGVHITVSENSTLFGARTLKGLLDSLEDVEDRSVGVLNFASAKNPGGGFITGAQAQEEYIARSSTIYASLMTQAAQRFYQSHKKDSKKGYYSHAMIYSPGVLFLRADKGEWMTPVEVEIVTSAAVNAGVVRRYLRENNSDETGLDAAMKERMARILYLFERHGVRNLVLGSFGTGVFRNRVELVAGFGKSYWLEKAHDLSTRLTELYLRSLEMRPSRCSKRLFRMTLGIKKDNSLVPC
ncbi:hypothetical protein BDZ97DRAFT_1904797 [Flammula alnicola]|nr:hypothetical protein BDZ97DRAFT_1904797 [Flammula alnicola]